MNLYLLESGKKFSLYAIKEGQNYPVIGFIESLERKEQVYILSLLKRISEHGTPFNDRKFKSIGNSIFEIKTKSGSRILCFFGGKYIPSSLILTHGFQKPKRKELNRKIKITMKLLASFEKESSQGQLIISK